MARKLIDRKDVLDDLVNVVLPKYFPDKTLDKNRVSLTGYITESLANAIEDTVTLEQRRAAEYCPELSSSQIHVRQTAKLRGVDVLYATPGKAFAVLGVLKSDILKKGTKSANETTFVIDRRSTISHGGVHFSLEDDIIIRAVQRGTDYVYAASYSGEHSTYESYIQMYEQIDDLGQELVSMIVQIYQFNYNIQEKVVVDEIAFQYSGIPFDYDHQLANFEVYYKQDPTDTYKKLEKKHYLTMEATDAIFYNDDDDNILYILNNLAIGIRVNAMIKVEMKETLGVDGMVTVGDAKTTFSLYRDGSYNYSGINVYINMLSDTTAAADNDKLPAVKARLIDAKVRRDNITTEHDILSYINDRDANVQVIKKRNDIKDHRYYLYTLLRHNGEIVPATTKRVRLLGIQSVEDYGDFDIYQPTVDRKVIKAYSKFKLVTPKDLAEEEYAIKIPHDEPEEKGEFYYTCPFMMLINDLGILSYYYNSVNTLIPVHMKNLAELYPFQLITRGVAIYRNAHSPEDSDTYTFGITGTLNTSNDTPVVDDDDNLIDPDIMVGYLVFRVDNNPIAYLPLHIDKYDPETREFTFLGQLKTTDYVTEKDKLEILEGLFKNGTDTNYYSVIDYKSAFFDVYFMYKDPAAAKEYPRSDVIYQVLPETRSDGYVLMSGYYNTPLNPYDLLLEFNKFTISPVKIKPYTDTTYQYSVGEVPLLRYDYGIEHTVDMYQTFSDMFTLYTNLLKLTTSFDISLKFTGTYGRSRYIMVTGGRDSLGEEIQRDLENLNPTFYFKVYGKDIDVPGIQRYIYEYLRDTYITGSTVFMSNICTLVEQNFTNVKSIKYMGVDDLDASFQEFIYNVPVFTNVDIVTKFVPEQLNATDIQIVLDET